MNRQRSIAVFAVIAAIAITTISLSGASSTPLMVSSVPNSQAGVGILGHVEYTLMDSENSIVQYSQGDNIVVHAGKDCTARLLFGAGVDSSECAETTPLAFNYIAIGNATDGESVSAGALKFDGANTSAGRCASTATNGEMARKLADVAITTAATGASGTVVELTTPEPFTFSNTLNASSGNTVEQSGLFNGVGVTGETDPHGLYDGVGALDGTGTCEAAGVNGTDWQMFSYKELNSGNGIAVTDGDSLSVKWTITLGA